MEWLPAVLVVVAFVATIVIHTLWTNRRPVAPHAPHVLEHRRVLVNLTTGTSMSGVVWQQVDGWIVLKAAQYLERGEGRPIEGEVVVEVAKVEFIVAYPPAGE